jgi:cytoskeletal protein RodZ
MKSPRVRRSALPSRWALIVLAVCVAASMFINYRASAQSTANKPEQTATAAGGKADPAKTDSAKTDSAKADQGSAEPATKPGEPAASKGRAPASKAEDSATIQDDPTLVPDDKESADNNITFPIDI